MKTRSQYLKDTVRENGGDGSLGNVIIEGGGSSPEVVPTKPGRVRPSSPDRYRVKPSGAEER